MVIGNFKETSENDEAKENVENTEKPRNQILETPDRYDDDFDSKLDDNEVKENRESQSEGEDSDKFKPQDGEEKQSLLDKMRNLFSRKESDSKNESDEKTNEGSDMGETDEAKSFRDSLKVDNYEYPDLENSDRAYENKPESSDGTKDDARGYEHGEDGERTRWSDAQWAREHERE